MVDISLCFVLDGRLYARPECLECYKLYLTRRCGSVHLGVVVVRVCEVCYVCEGYVGSAVVLCI